MRREVRRLAGLAVGGVRRAPVSVGLLVAIWVLAIVTGSALNAGHDVRMRFGLSIPALEQGRWWTLLTAGLWAPHLLAYLIATVLILVVAAPVERRIGSVRFVVAAVVTQVLGSLLALAAAWAARVLDEDWGLRLHVGTALSPTIWIVGVAMVASSNMETLWRRRTRVGLLALLITLALFGGHLDDVARLCSALVGLLVGPLIVGRSARGPRLAGTRREGRVLVAIVVAASALGPALAALSPNAVGPFAVLRELFRGVPYTPSEVRELCTSAPGSDDCRSGELGLRLAGVGPTILSLMPTLALLVLADGLRRGRRFAWIGAVLAQVVLLALSVFNYLVRFVSQDESVFYGLDTPSAYRTITPFLTPLAVLIVLLWTRRYFGVRAPAGTYRRRFGILAIVTVALAAVYVLGGLAAGGGFDRRPTFWGLLADFPERLIPPVYLQWLDPQFLPDSALTTLLFEWTGVVFWAVLCVLMLGSFLVPAYGTETAATERARDLLRRGQGSPLEWMTTWRGNLHWFAPDGASYVAYRVIGGVALTTGDPVGPRDRLRDTVVGFAEFAAGNGWTPCFYSVSSQCKAVADELGWSGLQVAEETLLDLPELAFTGKKFQDIRTALNRAKKSGVEAEWLRFGSAPLAITDQITAISEEWVADKGLPEMGFTLGGLEQVDDPEVRLLVAIDADRTVHGVTSWLPVYDNGRVTGWTLDFMRRRSEGFRPAMEFLIASAAMSLKDEGVQVLSLSGAPLAKVPRAGASEDAPSEPALERLLDVLGRTLEPIYGFRSLLAFKAKFQPRYDPMYMVYPDPAALPSIANAIGRAYLPDVSIGESVRLVRSLLDR
ncbi:MAG TPA: phosphatidylglycerol lysyltransferase domain-containing protein [Aldersonia sp.]